MNDLQEYARRWVEDQRRAGMKPSVGLIQYPRWAGKRVLAEALERLWAQGIPPTGEPVTRGQVLSYVEPPRVRTETLARCDRAVRAGQVRRWSQCQ